MDVQEEVRWRLRIDDTIVGYERYLARRMYSSTDGLWWRGHKLNYTEKDRCLMIRDVNNQWIFEKDLVSWGAASGLWLVKYKPTGWLLVQDGFSCTPPRQDRVLRRDAFAFVK